jgi:hypothetical protein
MKFPFYCLVLLISSNVISQTLTGTELLDKAIVYHDPSGNWQSFDASLHVTMKTPKSSDRESEIKIDLPGEYFYVKSSRDTTVSEYILNKENCRILLNGKEDLSEAILSENNLSCERAKMYKNYYTYLYGLPMKLKDAGTHISKEVDKKKFKGKDYLVLKATYDKAVGSDVWFFYFNPESYAMEIYQFFKGDPAGEGKDTGEYILLSETDVIHGIKMPKIRAWYYNKDDRYLGTDMLQN